MSRAARVGVAGATAGLVVLALAPLVVRDATAPEPEALPPQRIEVAIRVPTPEPAPGEADSEENGQREARDPEVGPPPEPASKPGSTSPGPSPVEPEPSPPRRPAAPGQPASSEPAPSPDARADRSRGESLLRAGVFPRLRATYRSIGFAAYRDAVLAIGGSFFLFDAAARRPVAALDPRSGETGPPVRAAALSRWPRDVTRHLRDHLEVGRARYGARVTRVVLLPPAAVDELLLGALDRALRAQGLDVRALEAADVAYELEQGCLFGRLIAVRMADGSERPLALRVRLGGEPT